jgi:putative flippase GtrA
VRIVRYFAIGLVGSAIDLAIFAAMVSGLGIHYLVSGATSFIVATAIHYRLTIRFVFEPGLRFGRKGELLAIYAVSATGLMAHQGFLYLGATVLGQNVYVWKLVAIGTVFSWNYLARKHFVFAEPGRAR